LVGDPLEKTWIPYLGIRGIGRKCCGTDCKGRPLTTLEYKWRLRASPIAWNYLTDPMRIHCVSAARADITEVNTSYYTMNGRNGLYLDADLEGLMPLGQSLSANVWAKGSWLSFSGQPVDLEYTVLAVPQNDTSGSSIFGAQTPGKASSSEGSFHRNFYAVGVSLDLSF
jgi:hypothetical protein